MTVLLEQRSIFKAYNASVGGKYMTLRIDGDSPWCYGNLFALLREQAEKGVRYLLIDKRNHITQMETLGQECKAKGLSSYIAEHNIVFAAVLNDNDHLEKIACYGLMRKGVQILSTNSMEEAVLWLGGSLK
jgi:hypothetical protein